MILLADGHNHDPSKVRPIYSRFAGRAPRKQRLRAAAQRAIDAALGFDPAGELRGIQVCDCRVSRRVGTASTELAGAATALRGGFSLDYFREFALIEPAAGLTHQVQVVALAGA